MADSVKVGSAIVFLNLLCLLSYELMLVTILECTIGSVPLCTQIAKFLNREDHPFFPILDKICALPREKLRLY